MTKWQADCGYGSCRADIGGELFAGGSLASRLLTTFDEYGSCRIDQIVHHRYTNFYESVLKVAMMSAVSRPLPCITLIDMSAAHRIWGSEQQSAQSDLINTLFLLLR